MNKNIGKMFITIMVFLIIGILGSSNIYAAEEIFHKDIDGNLFEYEGPLKNNHPHGNGLATYTNGDVYVGQYKDGKKHGLGTYTWAGGDKYVGEFSNDKEHGKGTYTWTNGDKYVGEFKENHPVGGWLYWPDGSKARTYKDSKGNWIYK